MLMRREVLLSTQALRAGYGGKPVLQGLEIEVREGEIVAVIGRNGVGKSTLMKSLIGLVPAARSFIAARPSKICRRISGRGSAWAMCRRAATCFRA
jgi:ABC-type branched-subunit amino acid transport system ATPase component